MQFLKLSTRLLMVSLVLMCYTSCQKDNTLYNEITTVQNHPKGESISLYQKQEVQHAVKQLLSDRRSLVRSFSENYEIDTTRVLKMKFNDEHTTYTLNIKHSFPGKLINLVFKENNNLLSQPYVFEYHMSPQTVDRYYANQKQLLSYEGTIKQARFYDYFSVQSTRNNTDCGCFKNFVSIQTQIGGSNDPDQNPQDGTWSGNSGFPNFDLNGGFDPPTNGGGGSTDCTPSLQIYQNLLQEYEILLIRSCNLLVANFNTDCDNFDPGAGILFGQNNDLQNYMQHEHNPYSNIMLECLTNDIATKIDELKAQKLYDPCTGNEIKVDVDMLAKALCYGCIKSSGLTVQNLEDAYYEALAGVDYINIPLGQFDICPMMKCILKNLKEGKLGDNLSNRICNIFQPNNNPKVLNITLNGPAFASVPNGIAGAAVSIDKITGKKSNSIYINPNQCNLHNDPLKLLTSIQHELVHVDIHNKLLSIYGWNGSDTTMQVAFDAMVAAEYPGKSYANHHQLILGEYLNEMLNGIRQANGGVGLPHPNENDIYLGIVLDAFPEDLAFISNTLGFTKADIDKFVKNFNTWIPSNKSTSGIYQTCP